MPIRINLLAEALAVEEQRRKDPVKRGTYVGAFLVLLVGVWGALLQVRILSSHSALSALDTKWKSIEKNYQVAVETQRKNIETEQKLAALEQMTTNRFLWGNVLNAFQQTLNGIDDVQVVRLRADQTYIVSEGTPARTNGTTVVAGKPPSAVEKILVTVDAMDTSAQPGSRVNRFKESIANVPYFKESLTKTNGVLLTSRSAPQTGQNSRSPFVMFTLQCYFPEKTR